MIGAAFRNASRAQSFAFLAPAPKHERITALEPYNLPAIARVRNQQLVDLFLRETVIAAVLPCKYKHGFCRRVFEKNRIDEPVVNYHVGITQKLQAAHKPQAEAE